MVFGLNSLGHRMQLLCSYYRCNCRYCYLCHYDGNYTIYRSQCQFYDQVRINSALFLFDKNAEDKTHLGKPII